MYQMADPIIKSLDENFMLDYLNGTRLGPAGTEAGLLSEPEKARCCCPGLFIDFLQVGG